MKQWWNNYKGLITFYAVMLLLFFGLFFIRIFIL